MHVDTSVFLRNLGLYLMCLAGMLASWYYYYYILHCSVNKHDSVFFLLEEQYFYSFFCLNITLAKVLLALQTVVSHLQEFVDISP